VLLVALAAATIEVEEDVEGGPPRRCLLLSSIAVHSDFYKKDVGGNK
jgi:hypothetical protein